MTSRRMSIQCLSVSAEHVVDTYLKKFISNMYLFIKGDRSKRENLLCRQNDIFVRPVLRRGFSAHELHRLELL